MTSRHMMRNFTYLSLVGLGTYGMSKYFETVKETNCAVSLSNMIRTQTQTQTYEVSDDLDAQTVHRVLTHLLRGQSGIALELTNDGHQISARVRN